MAPAMKRKTPADVTDSKDVPSTKPLKKGRSAPKKSGPYKFTFGPHKGATIKEAYS